MYIEIYSTARMEYLNLSWFPMINYTFFLSRKNIIVVYKISTNSLLYILLFLNLWKTHFICKLEFDPLLEGAAKLNMYFKYDMCCVYIQP